jgi:L-lactate dehydrogenase complex protein LldF
MPANPAIRHATHRALANRKELLKDYPRWEEWRRQARAIKTGVISNLDCYLAQLAAKVSGWGGQVLYAHDRGQAVAHISAVAHRHGVRRVVKAKSMTTEELALNHHLEAAGLEITETDLGEFIIQLAKDSPAHLTAPALHLNRDQIAGVFFRRLGVSCPPDPHYLTRLAADHLRPCFAQAQMGITGVNFAAASDGALVMLENEGNLRLSMSVPAVHLAVMGVEKLLSALADLPVFLRLLPASATGQRLTSLVHVVKGLKTIAGGQQAFYLVVLDNGRRRLAEHPDLKEALFCLRCGACLNICPVFQVGAAHLYRRVYPGAIGILLAPYLLPTGDIADLCTQCGACADLCPVAINLPDMILKVRQRSRRSRYWRPLIAASGRVLEHPRLYRGAMAAWRQLQQHLPPGKMASLPALPVAPASFWEQVRPTGSDPAAQPPLPGRTGAADRQRYQPGQQDTSDPVFTPAMPEEMPPPSPALLAARLKEVSSSLYYISGPEALARLLLEQGAAPLWLEDHPWLRAVAPFLEAQGVPGHFPDCQTAPTSGTAVTVALGAVPETGSVLVPGGTGPSSRLPLQTRRHIMLVPPGQANLTLSEAINLIRQTPAPLISCLTGPTRTADIEKVLVLGAQGPREALVVLYSPHSEDCGPGQRD